MNLDMIILIALIVSAAIGLLYIIAGYSWIRILVAIEACIILGAASYYILITYFSLSLIINIVIAAGICLIMGVLFYFLYSIGIFLIGVVAGGILCFLIIDILYLPTTLYVLIPAGLVCLLLGLLNLTLKKSALIPTTSFFGASFFAISLGYIIFKDIVFADFIKITFMRNPITDYIRQYSISIILIIAGFFIVGMLIQFFLTGKKQALVKANYIGKHRKTVSKKKKA